MRIPYQTIVLLALLAALVAACSAGPTPTLAPTIALDPTATFPPTATAAATATQAPSATLAPTATQPAAPTSYPAPGEATAIVLPTGDAYPPPPPPAGVPAIDNLSTISARLVERAADSGDPSLTRLRVEVLTSKQVEGLQEFTSGLVGKQVDMYASTLDIPNLNPGDTFTADVTFRGDEFGGRYFITYFP